MSTFQKRPTCTKQQEDALYVGESKTKKDCPYNVVSEAVVALSSLCKEKNLLV